MKTQKTPLKKSSQKALKKATRKPAAKKAVRKTLAKKLSKTSATKASLKEKEKEFPGYPKYPANEDIMNQGKRVEGNLDDEVITGKRVDIDRTKPMEKSDNEMPEGVEDDLKDLSKNESDVTAEDLQSLGPKDLSMDMGDDEQLKQRSQPVDFAGEDLDIPGSELDDDKEEIGSEDEENNSYSLGGDNHEDLEESRA